MLNIVRKNKNVSILSINLYYGDYNYINVHRF